MEVSRASPLLSARAQAAGPAVASAAPAAARAQGNAEGAGGYYLHYFSNVKTLGHVNLKTTHIPNVESRYGVRS